MPVRLPFPFVVIDYTDLVPGHTYNFQVEKGLTKKTNAR
jgi:hypothetical protein